MKLNILAVVAHPADSFEMIGGTLANHNEAGDKVVLSVMHSIDTLNLFSLSDEQREVRIDQQKIDEATEKHMHCVSRACKILGLEDIRFLKYRGDWLTYSHELVERIARLIQEVRPHILITHNPLEDSGASEHAACGKAVVEALFVSEGAREIDLPPHRVGQVYFICRPGITSWLDAQSTRRFGSIQIDITKQIEKKVRAYAKLSAQYMSMEKSAKILEGTSGGPGLQTRVAYVELFQAYRPEVYSTLPISEHNVLMTERGWKEGLKKLKLIAPYVKDKPNH